MIVEYNCSLQFVVVSTKLYIFFLASRKLTHLNAEEDSIWLYDVLDTIGVNGYYKEQHRHRGIMCEILESFQNDVSTYYMGSSIEGTTTPGTTYILEER